MLLLLWLLIKGLDEDLIVNFLSIILNFCLFFFFFYKNQSQNKYFTIRLSSEAEPLVPFTSKLQLLFSVAFLDF